MSDWQVKPEVLGDNSIAYNVEGPLDVNELEDIPHNLRIGCCTKRAADALARQLNAASFVMPY